MRPVFGRPRQKFNATPMVVEGIRFQSRREATRYLQLRALELRGEIRQLERQVPFPIETVNLVTGEITRVARYFADFTYLTADGRRVVEDAKGMRTETYKLKKRLVEAQHGITITEV